ncbi:hypothetical protein [Catenulispora subtropica]|uniref:Uncharacterized protein n=1 Tax=Catenulispora subtropica TaxID=450798 RepID=A0ABN2S6Q9_9ACTN
MATEPAAPDQPNVVLRGGPLDGAILVVRSLHNGIEREGGGQIHTYVPTEDADDEYPTMTVFIYAGSQPAAWLGGGLVG